MHLRLRFLGIRLSIDAVLKQNCKFRSRAFCDVCYLISSLFTLFLFNLSFQLYCFYCSSLFCLVTFCYFSINGSTCMLKIYEHKEKNKSMNKFRKNFFSHSIKQLTLHIYKLLNKKNWFVFHYVFVVNFRCIKHFLPCPPESVTQSSPFRPCHQQKPRILEM